MIIIHDSEHYCVTSYGNGSAYTIERKRDSASLWIQDDDALELMSEIEAGSTWDDALSNLMKR